jgi:hypothetical protein
MGASAIALGLGLAVVAGCGASSATSASRTDGGSPSEDASAPTPPAADATAWGFDADLEVDTADLPAKDGAGLPPDSASYGHASNALADGAALADAAPEVPPFTDPFDGASGCPDGGYPLGRGPCAAAFPLSGYPSLSGVFQPGACDNNNDGYASVWFASDYGYGQNTTNVHVDFSTPLTGMIGPQPVIVSIDVPDGDFNRLTWSTAPGACTVTLHTDVCWDFEQVQYYLVDGTGHCSSQAVSAGDAGGSLTVGDFWFQTISYP